jgi:VPDSG-CTERM motif
MKSLKYLFAIAAVTAVLTLSAKADLMFLGAVDFNNGPNSPAANLAALAAFGIDITGFDADNPTTNIEDIPEGAGDQTISVLPGEFLVAHYGVGKGGTGSGGSLEFFQVINGETTVTVPGEGNGPTNPDPYGHGGISSIRGFGGTTVTPDSGATVMLLGGALAGLGLVRRYLKQ